MSTLSPNMNLPISTVGVNSGLDWENNLNSSLSLIDLHDHSSGKGVPLTPSSLNINADFPLNTNNLTLTRSVRFTPQSAALALVTDIGCLYEAGVDLYYNDGSGNQIRLTQSGSIVGTAGSITGLPSGTASAAFAAGVFTFQASTATGANIDGASHIFRNATANSKGLTLSPPNAMAADYSLVLPSVPGTTNFMQLDSSGNMSATIAVLGALTTSNLSASAGILGTQIASATLTAANIANATITSAKIVQNTITGGATGNLALATIADGNMVANTLTGSSIVSNVNLQGLGVKAGGRCVIAAGANTITTNGLVIGRATFLSDGTLIAGEGITYVSGGLGNLVIDYTGLSFASRPTVLLTSTADATAGFCYTGSVNSTTANIINSGTSGMEVLLIGIRSA